MRVLWSSLLLAFRSVAEARLRSLLTSLGILVGVVAVVTITALTTGARTRMGERLSTLGSNVVFVFSRPSARSGVSVGNGLTLTDRDVDAVRREVSGARATTVYSGLQSQVRSAYSNANTSVMGVDSDYFTVRGYHLAEGRHWSPAEERSKAKVVLLGKTAARKLFGEADPVGSRVTVGRQSFLVIGTLAEKGASVFDDQDDRLVMPISTWRSSVSPGSGDRVHIIMASARSPAHVATVEEQLVALLRQRHHIRPGEEDDFMVRSQAAFQRMQEGIYDVLTALLLAVAAISLIVGGVGVMNIMLVSVTERTREIGLRMAIGATRADIQLQFLVEATLLTLMGGVGGVLASLPLVALLERVKGYPMHVSGPAVALALGISVVIGLLFGFLPARRASALDPIDALRHE